jgi:hypothetical protein
MLDGWIPISGAVFALQLGRGSHTAPVASEWPPPAAHPCVAGFRAQYLWPIIERKSLQPLARGEAKTARAAGTLEHPALHLMGLVRSRWTDRALDMPPTSPSAALPADCIHVAS